MLRSVLLVALGLVVGVAASAMAGHAPMLSVTHTAYLRVACDSDFRPESPTKATCAIEGSPLSVNVEFQRGSVEAATQGQ